MNLKKVLVTLSFLCLVGCQQQVQTLTPQVQQEMTVNLKAGRLTLTCGFDCSFTWIQRAPQIHALDIAERWQDLAVAVMQVGRGNDLAYYYLGQAAQGLGYHQAAIGYYQYSLALSQGQDGTLRCDATENCQGVDIASVAPVLIKASQDALAAAAVPPPPVAPPPPRKRKPAPQPQQQPQRLLLPPPPAS